MQIRQDAKMGLKKMEAMGQMGNSDEATMDDDMPFGMADLIVVGGKGEPMEFADGGFVPVQNFQVGGTPKRLTFKDLMGGNEPELVLFVNAAGEKLMVPFVNGVPLFPIPTGYTVFVPVEGEEVTAEDANIAEVVNALNTPRAEKEYDPMKGVNTKPTNWMDPDMDGSSFLEKLKTSNMYGTARTVMEVGLAFVPALGFLGKMAFRHQDKAVLAAIEERAKRGDFNTPELQEQAVLAAEAIEKASSSVLGKVFDAVGGLLGKEKDEIDAAVRIQNAINEANKNGLGIVKTDKGGIGLDFDYSEFYDAEGNLKTDTTVTSPVITSTEPDGFSEFESKYSSSPSLTNNLTPNDFSEFESKYSSSPSISTDFKNLSTKDKMDRLNEKGAVQSYGLKTVKDPSYYDYLVDEGYTGNLKNLNPDEMQAIQNLQMVRDARSSFDNIYEYDDRLSQVAGGTKVEGSPAPVSQVRSEIDQQETFPLTVSKAGKGPTVRATTSYDPYANIAKVQPSTVTQPVKIVPPSSVQAVQLAKDKKNDFDLGDTARKIADFFKEKIPGRTIDAAGNPITDTSVDKNKDDDYTPSSADIAQQLKDEGKVDRRRDQSNFVNFAKTSSGKRYTTEAKKDDYDPFEDIGVKQTTGTTSYGGSGPRAKGGLINKPVKTKKTKKTKKRGLAAR